MSTRYSKGTHKFDNGMGGLRPGHITWNYSNTSDILAVHFHYEKIESWAGAHEASTRTDYFGRSEALALLNALSEWDNDT